ncbi:MAG TPA: DUF885 domain-containing protein [Longimicrobiaceae bacterium]|nr:DUF885 domain-containing protein [Longimicrobiaceae bacterium]
MHPHAFLRRLPLAAAVLLAACAPTRSTPSGAVTAPPVEAATPAQAAYDRFARDFLDWHYADDPVRATRLGIHAHDHRLPDLTRAGIERRTRELHGWLDRLQAIDRARLSADASIDHRILDHAIRARILELEEVRGWQRNPGVYNAVAAGAVASLASREFAPLPVRLEAMIARFDSLPALLAAGRANLDGSPHLWIRQAIADTRGTSRYLQTDLPAALRVQGLDALDAELVRRWSTAGGRAAAELERFAAWLETDLLQRDTVGDFRLGRGLFERKLRYEEHVDLSADELRAINERAVADYQAWVAREAARIDPRRTPAAVMDSLARQHPTAAELLPTARRQLDEIRRFVVQRGIVTLPSERMPVVRESPPYARSGFASMDAPGPLETVATEAFYNITNVDPRWSGEQQEQHLTYFNHAGLLGITVHEAIPGHFVQLLYRPQIATEVRRVFQPTSLVEGWAHYAEQMMVDEGLGGGDPAVRLGQLRRALQRHARWDAGLAMHAFGDSVAGAARRFERIAFFAPFPALRETERGTSDPTYLYYALGRMQILKLREDYRRHLESQGRTFSLREFHDRFLRLGLPVSLAREVMMPGDTGTSL